MHQDKALTTLFFRNDDIRNVLDQSLIDLTMLCVENYVPISHAVEPANLSQEVAEWLINIKKRFPDYVEIIQHGYNHNLANPHKKMEFGGKRDYQDQYNDILKGKEIMDRTFGSLWEPIFTFPYGTYNKYTLTALDQLEYKAISSKIKFDFKGRIKNTTGKFFGQDVLFGKRINYHPDIRKGYKFREISVSVNLIKKYTGETIADHYSEQELLDQINLASRYSKIIGVLFHHRFHHHHLNLTNNLIKAGKERSYHFAKLSDLIK